MSLEAANSQESNIDTDVSSMLANLNPETFTMPEGGEPGEGDKDKKAEQKEEKGEKKDTEQNRERKKLESRPGKIIDKEALRNEIVSKYPELEEMSNDKNTVVSLYNTVKFKDSDIMLFNGGEHPATLKFDVKVVKVSQGDIKKEMKRLEKTTGYEAGIDKTAIKQAGIDIESLKQEKKDKLENGKLKYQDLDEGEKEAIAMSYFGGETLTISVPLRDGSVSIVGSGGKGKFENKPANKEWGKKILDKTSFKDLIQI